VRIKGATGVYDARRIINPRLACSQIMSGMLFGFRDGVDGSDGAGRTRRTGRECKPAEYHVPDHTDAPEFDIDFINEPDPHMPDLGAWGSAKLELSVPPPP
jgi:xanthine dehydrogenase YagR molybdenum-binding subunit